MIVGMGKSDITFTAREDVSRFLAHLLTRALPLSFSFTSVPTRLRLRSRPAFADPPPSPRRLSFAF